MTHSEPRDSSAILSLARGRKGLVNKNKSLGTFARSRTTERLTKPLVPVQFRRVTPQDLRTLEKLYLTTCAKPLNPRSADHGLWIKSGMALIFVCSFARGVFTFFKELGGQTKEYFL